MSGCVSQCFLFSFCWHPCQTDVSKNCYSFVFCFMQWINLNSPMAANLPIFPGDSVLSEADSLGFLALRVVLPVCCFLHQSFLRTRDIDLLYIRPFLTSFEAQSSVTAFGLNRWSVGKKSGPIMPVPVPICPSLFYLCISVWLLTLKVCFQPCWTYVFLLCISGFFLWAHSVLLLDKASERCFRGNWIQYKKEGMQSGICFYVCMNYL